MKFSAAFALFLKLATVTTIASAAEEGRLLSDLAAKFDILSSEIEALKADARQGENKKRLRRGLLVDDNLSLSMAFNGQDAPAPEDKPTSKSGKSSTPSTSERVDELEKEVDLLKLVVKKSSIEIKKLKADAAVSDAKIQDSEKKIDALESAMRRLEFCVDVNQEEDVCQFGNYAYKVMIAAENEMVISSRSGSIAMEAFQDITIKGDMDPDTNGTVYIGTGTGDGSGTVNDGSSFLSLKDERLILESLAGSVNILSKELVQFFSGGDGVTFTTPCDTLGTRNACEIPLPPP